jgi:hypothetical protein
VLGSQFSVSQAFCFGDTSSPILLHTGLWSESPASIAAGLPEVHGQPAGVLLPESPPKSLLPTKNVSEVKK